MRSPESPPRALPLMELAGLVLVALASLAFQLTLPGRLPEDADWKAVRARLEAEARPGDAVLLLPWWAERARLHVPPHLPVYGHLGVEREALTAHPRLWVLGQPGLPRAGEADFLAAFLPGRTPRGESLRAGALTLALYENGRHRPRRFVASEAHARARVYLESPQGQRHDCRFDGQAHRCPGPSHLYVAPEWHELRYQPRRCLWMHAPGGPERLVAEFDGVPAGTALRLEGGIIFEHAWSREPGLTPARLGVDDAASGQRLVDLVLPPGLEGVQHAELALPPGPPRTVKVWVQADNVDRRQVCLDVYALGEGPAAPEATARERQ